MSCINLLMFVFKVTDGNVETTSSSAVRRPQRRRRPRSNSRASNSSSATAISDTLRMLDLDSNARFEKFILAKI